VWIRVPFFDLLLLVSFLATADAFAALSKDEGSEGVS
jgi:hypothetical protein